jgi:hypothetical protein
MPANASPSTTSVSVVATVDFLGQPVVINSGDISGGVPNLVFSINQPITIGSIHDFINWVTTEFGITSFSGDSLQADIEQIPTTPAILNTIREDLLNIFNANLVLNVLNITTRAGLYQVGVSFEVNIQLPIIPLQLKGIGVMVSHGVPVTSP